MKKYLCFALALLLILLTACTPATPEEPTVTTTAATTAATTEALADQGIKNIIIIIGDGMGNVQLEAGQLAASKKFGFTEWEHTLVNTNSLDSQGNPTVTTDSAAAGTALATGTLTRNGRIGQAPDGTNLKTIMDYASQDFGKATGIVTTDALYGATPATFSGHASSRYDYDSIITSQIQSDIDLLCGTYAAEAMSKRATIKDLGYTLSSSFYDAKNSMDEEKNYWLLSLSGDEAPDKLSDVTSLALDYLSQDEDGFMLMIEQANIDGHGHNNTFDGLPQCVNILNDTVESILEWIGDRTDTAIIVTADHETGGLQISTEPNGNPSFLCDDGKRIYYDFATTNHTPAEVSCFVYGFDPQFEKYYTKASPNAIKNVSIFQIMLELLEYPLQEN